MTLPDHDHKRSYKKPVEEVARALQHTRVFGVSLAFTEECDNDTPMIRALRRTDTRLALGAARIAIDRLRELGFLSDLGIAAIRAEEGEGK